MSCKYLYEKVCIVSSCIHVMLRRTFVNLDMLYRCVMYFCYTGYTFVIVWCTFAILAMLLSLYDVPLLFWICFCRRVMYLCYSGYALSLCDVPLLYWICFVVV